MNEYDSDEPVTQPAEPAPAAEPAASEEAATGELPAAYTAAQSRGGSVRQALASRSAGWMVASALGGALVTLAVVVATGTTNTTEVSPLGAVSVGPAPFSQDGSQIYGIHAVKVPAQFVPGGIVGPAGPGLVGPTGPGFVGPVGPGFVGPGMSWTCAPGLVGPMHVRINVQVPAKIFLRAKRQAVKAQRVALPPALIKRLAAGPCAESIGGPCAVIGPAAGFGMVGGPGFAPPMGPGGSYSIVYRPGGGWAIVVRGQRAITNFVHVKSNQTPRAQLVMPGCAAQGQINWVYPNQTGSIQVPVP